MFYSLPTETKLDVFKFLNYQQLRSIKQTNLYFRDFINNFGGELALENFSSISIEYYGESLRNCTQKLHRSIVENFDFPLNEQLEEKLKNVPVCLRTFRIFKDGFCLTKVDGGKDRCGFILPTIITNKEDIKIVYYYLNKLFHCYFRLGNFKQFIFNPELIQLLFGNSKQVKVQRCYLFISKHNIENLFQFIFNHLVSEHLRIELCLLKDIMEKYKDNLFKILTNGDNFKEVNLTVSMDINKIIYDQIVEYIATSTDCSKMVPIIIVNFSVQTNVQMSELAENVEIELGVISKYTNYQIANIYNPEVRFSFYNKEQRRWINQPFYSIRVIIMKPGHVHSDPDFYKHIHL